MTTETMSETRDAGPSTSDSPLVLAVDDRPENLVTLRHIFQGMDLELLEAGDGSEALSILVREHPALILLDVNMPGMDGFEVARLVRGNASTSTIPIIFLTASDPGAQRHFEGYDAGAVDYLTKPLEADVLRSKVRVFLELDQKRRALQDALRRLQDLNDTLEERVLERTRELRESQERFQAAVRGAGAGIWVHDLVSAELFMAPRLEEMLGRTDAGSPPTLDDWIERITPQDRPRVRALLTDPPAEPFLAEYRLQSDGAHSQWHVLRGAPATPGRDHEVTRIAGAVTDVTSQKVAEGQRALLAAALSQSAEAVIVADETETITFANEAAQEITGFSRGGLVGQPLALVTDWRGSSQDAEAVRATLDRGQSWSGLVTSRRKDDTRYEAEVTLSPITDDAGRVVSYFYIAKDVTRERMLERQLQVSERLEAVGRLVAGVAHDFNNILAVIETNATLALDRCDDDEILRDDLEGIHEAGRRAAKLIKQLLGFSSKRAQAHVVMDLNAPIRSMEGMLQRLCGSGVQLDVRLAADLPQVRCDEAEVEQVLANLVVNARDAMPDGGELEIATAPVVVADDEVPAGWDHAGPGLHARVTVRDSGTGMDRDTLDRVLEPFFTTKGSNGTGLGLATVYGIVVRSGGFLEIESAPDEGTEFRIYLPEAGPEGEGEASSEATLA